MAIYLPLWTIGAVVTGLGPFVQAISGGIDITYLFWFNFLVWTCIVLLYGFEKLILKREIKIG